MAKGGEKIRRQAIILLTTLVFAFILCGAVSAAGNNTTLNLTKGSTDNIGLDSNNVNAGPDHFIVQIHVNNTGNTTAHNVTGTFNFTSNVNKQYIYLDPQENATKYLGDIAPGTSADLFWLVNVNRTSSAYLKDRNYTITVLGNNTANLNTINGDLFVRKLVSQNRNHVTSITISNNNPTLGDTFAVTVVSDTSSSTYNYVDLSLINYDPTKVQPLSVNITYGSNTTNNILIQNPGVTDFVSVWIFRAIGAGNTPISALILDQSGASYHYNTDVNSTTINLHVEPKADLAITKTVDNSTPLQGSTVHFTLTVTNNGPNNATGVVVNDPLPAGLNYQSSSATQGSYNSGTGVWTIGNLAVNQTVTLNITALVTSVGQITNIANVTGNEIDPDISNNQAIVTLNGQQPLADLGITKTVDNPTPHLEDIFTFTVTVFNNGPNTAHNVTVTDIWPLGNLALLSAAPSQGTFNPSTFTWNIGTLISGAVATLTISTEGLQLGNFTNIVTVTANETDPDPADNTANVTVNVHPHIDLAVTKTVNNSTPNVGQNVTFTVNVANLGPQNGTGVIVNDLIPSGVTYVSSHASQGSYDPNTGIWTIGNLAVNQAVTLNITVTVNQTGQITNIAVASGNEHDHHPENNQGVAVINGQSTADLNIIKESDKTEYNNGNNVLFNFIVKNDGPNDAHNIKVSDLLPAGLNFVSLASISQGQYNPGTGIWTIGTLANGASATMEIIVKAVQTGFITNIATVNATEFDPHTADNTAAVTIHVNPSADLALAKTINPPSVLVGTNVTITLTATNNGPDNATGVIVIDPLPAGLIYVSDNSGGAYNPLTGVWNIGNLANGASKTLQITAKVTQDGAITNIAVVSGNENDPVTVNNQAIAIENGTPNADLAISKTVDKLLPHVGDTLTYTINLFNAGPSNAIGVVVNDTLSPVSGATLVNATPSKGSYNSVTGIWTVGNLNVGSLATLVLQFVVNATGDITNTVVANSTLPDPHLEDNNASVTVNGQPVADIGVKKVVTPNSQDFGQNAAYTITVTNNGPNDATGVVVTDPLPAGLIYVSDNSGGAYNPLTGVWNIGNLANGASKTLHIVFTVNSTGNVINTATKTHENEFDPDTTNDSDSAIMHVIQSDLYVNVTAPTKCLGLTDTAQITFKVGNRGPDTAKNTVLRFVVPDGMEFLNAAVDYGTYSYDAATRTITWNLGDVPVGDPSMIIQVRVLKEGKFIIRPTISTSTYDQNLVDNVGFANICVEPPVTPTNVVVNAKTIPLQKTGLPIGFLVAVILMVFAGLVPKRK